MRAFCRTTVSLRLLIALLASLGIGLHTGWAQVNEWTRVGWLEGGPVQRLIVDPQNPNTMFAIAAGIFKSTDGGANWRAATFGLPTAFVNFLVISPQRPGTLYAGAGGRGVFKSTDSGESWGPTGLVNRNIRQLAIDPQNARIMYAAAGGSPIESPAVYKTTDGGVSWARILPDKYIAVMAVDPERPGTVYAGDEVFGGVYKSTDGGDSWALVMNGCLMTALIIPQQDPGALYAAGSCFIQRGGDDILVPNVAKSVDGGESWSALNSGLPESWLSALAIDPQNPATLYAGTHVGIFKSTDGGTSWHAANPDLVTSRVNTLAIDPQNPNRIYAGTDAGVLKSTDGGMRWSSVNAGLNTIGISALAVGSREPNTLYAAAQLQIGPGRVVRSTDRGTTWSLVNPAGNIVTTGLAVDSRDGSVYAGTSEALFKSADGGASWALKSGRLADRLFVSLAIDAHSPNTVYVGTAGSGAFKSTDGGTSWREVNSGISDRPFPVVLALAVDPTTPGTVYAATSSGGLSKSTDAATTWTPLSSVPTETNIFALVVAPSIPSTIYAATTSRGLIKSNDGGTSWTSASFGMEANAVRALAMDPQNPNKLLAGTVRGLFTITFATQQPIRLDDFQFNQTSVGIGDSYIARASGTNLTAQTYFDIRYRAPNSSVDEEVLNWQTGAAAVHGIPADIGLGTWTVTGARAHEDSSDHTGSYIPVSAAVTVLADAAN